MLRNYVVEGGSAYRDVALEDEDSTTVPRARSLHLRTTNLQITSNKSEGSTKATTLARSES